MRFLTTALPAILLMAGCSQQPQAQIATPPTPTVPVSFPDAPLVPAAVDVTTIANGLKAPWGLAFLPSGDFIVTERNGGIIHVSTDGTQTPIAGVPDTAAYGQGGQQDIALSPNFATDQTVYVSYSYGTRSENGLAIMKAKLDGFAFTNSQVIYKSELRKNTTLHYGGRLLFMPDATLLVTLGEGSRYREKAQKLDSDYGKVLRLNPDGSAADGNPLAAKGALPQIYTYGHRNAQGMIYDNVTDTLWVHEHGPQGGDELNIVEAGKNYGWPVATFGIDYNGATISPFTAYDGMQNPVLHWTPSIAPSGMTLYRGELFPQWDGDLLVGGLKFQKLHRIDLDGIDVVGEQIVLDVGARVRDVRTGPDGAIYLLTDDPSDGKILRLTPSVE